MTTSQKLFEPHDVRRNDPACCSFFPLRPIRFLNLLILQIKCHHMCQTRSYASARSPSHIQVPGLSSHTLNRDMYPVRAIYDYSGPQPSVCKKSWQALYSNCYCSQWIDFTCHLFILIQVLLTNWWRCSHTVTHQTRYSTCSWFSPHPGTAPSWIVVKHQCCLKGGPPPGPKM